MDSFKHHVFGSDLHTPLCDVAVQAESQLGAFGECRHARVSISNNHNIQLKPCSCRGVAECGDPPVQCSSESISVQVLQLGCNPTPTFCKTHSTKLQVSDHGPIKCFVPKSAQLSLPPTRAILMSPLITRRCNHSVGVAICLIRQAPRRIAMARLAVASSFDFEAGTVNSIT